jgi:hypothetical protein
MIPRVTVVVIVAGVCISCILEFRSPKPRSDLQQPCSCCLDSNTLLTLKFILIRCHLLFGEFYQNQPVAVGRSGCARLQFPLRTGTGNPHYPLKRSATGPLINLIISSSGHLLLKNLQSIWNKHAALNAKAPDITAHSFFLFLIDGTRSSPYTSRARHTRRTLF